MRSLDLMSTSGNKFQDLFELSKQLKEHKANKDKSRDEYDFEKSQ